MQPSEEELAQINGPVRSLVDEGTITYQAAPAPPPRRLASDPPLSRSKQVPRQWSDADAYSVGLCSSGFTT